MILVTKVDFEVEEQEVESNGPPQSTTTQVIEIHETKPRAKSGEGKASSIKEQEEKENEAPKGITRRGSRSSWRGRGGNISHECSWEYIMSLIGLKLHGT